MSVMSGSKIYLVFLCTLAVLLAVVLIYSDSGILHLRALQSEQQKLKAENQVLKEKNRRLRQQIERIKTDPRYIEDEARNKLGLIRPDEVIYRLKEEPDQPPAEKVSP